MKQGPILPAGFAALLLGCIVSPSPCSTWPESQTGQLCRTNQDCSRYPGNQTCEPWPCLREGQEPLFRCTLACTDDATCTDQLGPAHYCDLSRCGLNTCGYLTPE